MQSAERDDTARPVRRTGLSKSRITLFEQCPKRLWLSVHRPELADEAPATIAAFAVGHRIGAVACALLSDGHMIEANRGLTAAVEETAALLANQAYWLTTIAAAAPIEPCSRRT